MVKGAGDGQARSVEECTGTGISARRDAEVILPDPRPFLSLNPIVPVVVIDDAAHAAAAGRALVAGGITCAEVTFRTEAGPRAIEAMRHVEGMTVGAGTILSGAQASRAVDSGAEFLVSPGWSPEIAEVAMSSNVAYLPGVQTATEIMVALEYGARVVKFFPASVAGGLEAVTAVRGPFPSLGFLPSGGVTAETMSDWLAHPAVPAISGSWMITRDLISTGKFGEVTELSRQAMTIVKDLP